jgi:ribonuclease Z
MNFELTILGTNAALPIVGRSPSAQVLQIHHHHFLIDCGEGTQLRMLETGVRHNRIIQIFISHLHGDHVFGLIGLLTTWHLSNREAPVDIFAPEGLEEMIGVQLESGHTKLKYPLEFHPIDTKRHALLFENEVAQVFSLPLDHRVPTSGFLFREKQRSDNIIPEKIETYQIPVEQISAIKDGADYILPDGRRIPHQELTVPAPPPRSFAYCADTRYRKELIPLVKGVDLLYHEATFLDDNKDRAHRTYHATARQAATLAKKAGVGQLVLGHFSSRYEKIAPFAEEARKVFPNAIAAEDGTRIEIPAPERGLRE